MSAPLSGSVPASAVAMATILIGTLAVRDVTQQRKKTDTQWSLLAVGQF
jgi:hypothetical protein